MIVLYRSDKTTSKIWAQIQYGIISKILSIRSWWNIEDYL